MVEIYKPRVPRHDQLTAKDIDDLQNDICLAAEVFFGARLTTATRYRFRKWAKHRYNIDCSGWGSFKTYSAAIYVGTVCCLFDGWHHAIIGLTGRQSKLQFKILEAAYNSNPLFRGRCSKPPTHYQDGWELNFFGESIITALPADLNRAGKRLESESQNSVTVEEFTNFGGIGVLELIDSRARRPNPHKETLDNFVLYLGSPEDADALVYRERIEPALERIGVGDPLYSYTALNVEILANFPDCWPFLDFDTYRNARVTMSTTRYEQKYLGRWRSGAGDLYPSEIWRADSKSHIVAAKRESETDEYVLGYDVAKQTCQFTMKALQYEGSTAIVRNGYAVKTRDKKPKELAAMVYRDYDDFAPGIVMIDAGGGGFWLVDSLIEYAEEVDREPLVRWDGDRDGIRVIYMFSSADEYVRRLLGNYDRDKARYVIASDDHLKNASHNAVIAAVERGELLFATSVKKCRDRIAKRLSPDEYEYYLDYEEPVLGNFEETKSQARDLRIKRGRDGNAMITKNGYYFIIGNRTDDIQALVHGYVGMMVYRYIHHAEGSESDGSSIVCVDALETVVREEEIDEQVIAV